MKPSTRAIYESVLETHVLPHWRDVPLASVEHEHVQAWIVELTATGMSGAHVRKIHTVLGGILGLAVKAKRLPVNPARDVELPSAASRPKKYLTAQQVETLAEMAITRPSGTPKRLSHQQHAQYRLVVYVLAYCGLRWSEMAALRVATVDLMRRRPTISSAVVEVDGRELAWGTPKSHEARWVPIPSFLVEELRAHLAPREPDDLVFTSPEGGVLRNKNARRAWFDRAAASAGVPGLTPHELRHTAASLAVSAGATSRPCIACSGTRPLRLDRYADLFDDDLEAVADRLGEVREAARVARLLHAAEVVEFDEVRK